MFVAGGYGYVFVAQDVRTGEDYALKVWAIYPFLSDVFYYLFVVTFTLSLLIYSLSIKRGMHNGVDLNTHTRPLSLSHTHTHTHTYPCAHIHTHTYPRTHTHTRTRTRVMLSEP